ncbi:MAG: CD225/dispanin family protein [Paludibacteraceae bacterium]|nr:CD225/dispanin family protein [Paludibacteraceae bacterium]
MANQITIGRNPQSTIVVDAKYNTVSGNHATITCEGNTLTFKDHSTNGSFVNGVKCHNGSMQIHMGDNVTLGQQYPLDMNEVMSLLGGHAATQRIVTPATARILQPEPIRPQEEYHGTMPEKHMELAIVSLILGFSMLVPMILSIIAIVNASNVESRWRAGDYSGAREASSKAKSLAWWSIVLAFILVFVFVASYMA